MIVICPIAIIIFLIVTNGWISIIIYFGGQCVAFALIGIEYLVNKRKSAQKQNDPELETDVSQSSTLRADIVDELQ